MATSPSPRIRIPLRIVVGVPELARTLRDAGHEVIYTGPGHSVEQIVATAIQEDADLIGLAEDTLAGALRALLEARQIGDIGVTVFPPGQDLAAR